MTPLLLATQRGGRRKEIAPSCRSGPRSNACTEESINGNFTSKTTAGNSSPPSLASLGASDEFAQRGSRRLEGAHPLLQVDARGRLMGLYAAKNAVLVAAQLRLGNAATRLLLHMALECWDSADNPSGAPPRRYFGGRETAAIALGFLAPDNGSEQAHRAVKRAIRELTTKGAIHRLRRGGNGHTAEFELALDSTRGPAARLRPVVALSFEDEQGARKATPQGANY